MFVNILLAPSRVVKLLYRGPWRPSSQIIYPGHESQSSKTYPKGPST